MADEMTLGMAEEGHTLALNMAVARVLRDGDSFESAARAFGLDVEELKAVYAKDFEVLKAAVLTAAEEWREAERSQEVKPVGKRGDEISLKHRALDALRSAVDELRRARGEAEKGGEG